MIPFSSTELPSLKFNPAAGENSAKHRAPTGKIGWLRAISENQGQKFDIVIKDGLGRIKYKKENCGNEESNEYGELVNLPTNIGEDLTVEVENVRGSGSLEIFLN